MLFALRPAATASTAAPATPAPDYPDDAAFLCARMGLHRYFVAERSGHAAGRRHEKCACRSWHAMLGIGLVMFALFGHLYFGPFRRLKQAVSASNWPEGGRRVGQIATLALVNLVLGVLAIAAVFFMI